MTWLALAKACLTWFPGSGDEEPEVTRLRNVVKLVEESRDAGLEGLSLYVTRIREDLSLPQIAGRSCFAYTYTHATKSMFVDLGMAVDAGDISAFFDPLVLVKMKNWLSTDGDVCGAQWTCGERNLGVRSCHLQ